MDNDAEKWRAYAEYLSGGANGAASTSTPAANDNNTNGITAAANSLAAYAGQPYLYPGAGLAAPPAVPSPPAPTAYPYNQQPPATSVFLPFQGANSPYHYSSPYPFPYHRHPQEMPPPPPPGYAPANTSPYTYGPHWQHVEPGTAAPLAGGSVPATAGTHPPGRPDYLRAAGHERDRWYHYEHRYPGQSPPPPIEPSMEVTSSVDGQSTIPVLLCHTCGECGRVRSSGFHRSHPVIPGQPLISEVCRRCRRKGKSYEEERDCHRTTHIRECRAEEPCDWPARMDDSIHIQVGGRHHRGRRRSRSYSSDDGIYISRHRSMSRPRVITRAESRLRMGVGALQERRSPVNPTPKLFRRKSRIRLGSMSPPRDHERVHVHTSREYARDGTSLFVGPPSPMEHPPVPLRRDDINNRSVSERHYRMREEYQPDNARYRIPSHPAAYRSVTADHHSTVLGTSEDLTPSHSPIRHSSTRIRISHSPTRPILKEPGMNYETSHRRWTSTNPKYESTHVEVGGPRVQFVQEGEPLPSNALRASESSEHWCYKADRHRGPEEHFSAHDDFDYHHRHARGERRYIEELPLSREFEDLRLRGPPLDDSSRGRRLVRETVTRTSPPPSFPPPGAYPPSPREEERIRLSYRHISRSPPPASIPPPRRPTRTMSYTHHSGPPPPSPIMASRITASHHRHSSVERHSAALEREIEVPVLSSSKYKSKEKEKDRDWEEEVTASDASGEVVAVRKWRGRDENGEKVTWVEERRTRS